MISGHPQTDIVAVIPVGVLLVWAAKILLQVTQAQQKLQVQLFGDAQLPGVIPTIRKEQEELNSKLHRVRNDLQVIVNETGVSLPPR